MCLPATYPPALPPATPLDPAVCAGGATGGRQGARDLSETILMASEPRVGTEHALGTQRRDRPGPGTGWEVGGFWEEQDPAGPQDIGIHRRDDYGAPVTCRQLGLTPAEGTGARQRSQGQPSSFLHPREYIGGLTSLLPCACLWPDPTATSCAKCGGHRPYLSLQRHSPQGQVAHGLICNFPPPHREVVEGVRQLLGVILRRDLEQSGTRQRRSVPVGTWASRWPCVPSWRILELCPAQPSS